MNVSSMGARHNRLPLALVVLAASGCSSDLQAFVSVDASYSVPDVGAPMDAAAQGPSDASTDIDAAAARPDGAPQDPPRFDAGLTGVDVEWTIAPTRRVACVSGPDPIWEQTYAGPGRILAAAERGTDLLFGGSTPLLADPTRSTEWLLQALASGVIAHETRGTIGGEEARAVVGGADPAVIIAKTTGFNSILYHLTATGALGSAIGYPECQDIFGATALANGDFHLAGVTYPTPSDEGRGYACAQRITALGTVRPGRQVIEVHGFDAFFDVAELEPETAQSAGIVAAVGRSTVGPLLSQALIAILDPGHINNPVFTYGGPGDDAAYAVKAHPNGGFVVAGSTTVARDDADFWLARFQEDGTAVWNERYDLGGEDSARALAALPDGWVLAGTSHAPALDTSYVVRTDLEGRPIWSRALSAGVTPYAALRTSDGAIVIAGSSGTHGWAVKLPAGPSACP